jgi:hypothetical protein
MAQPFWQMIQNRFRERNPFNIKTYDPTKATMVDGRDVTVGGQIPFAETSAARAMQEEGIRAASERERDKFRRMRAADIGSVSSPEFKQRQQLGGYKPIGSDPAEDQYDKLLRMMFMQQLMAGSAGDPPPQPYTVQVGPASRDFAPLNMYGRGL